MALLPLLFIPPYFILVLAATSCDSQLDPIVLPLKEMQVVSDIPDSIMRGISATVGTPPQNILMLPWADVNNTWIYDYEPFCDQTIIFDDDICHVRRGNFFFENASSTYGETGDIIAAGGAGKELTGLEGAALGLDKVMSESLAGTDTIIIGDGDGEAAAGLSLTNFPIGIPRLNWDDGFTTLHALGLGSNSTYLNALVDAGRLASRVWSIFWGRMWVSDGPIDGHVVIGGYDEEKVTGENVTQKLDYSETTGCWTGMKVTVSDIQLNFKGGKDVSILPSNLALQCCLVPIREVLLEAPNEILDNFNDATGMSRIEQSFSLHWFASTYVNKDLFDGDLTIHLSSGLQIRVPNSQFLVPWVAISRGGGPTFNESERDLLIAGVGDRPATLGRYFLTSAYLMVDYDASTFTLWQAKATNSSSIVSTQVSGGSESCGTSPSSDPSAAVTGGVGGQSSGTSDTSGTSSAAIGGGIAGGVAGILLIGVGIFFFLRSRRRKQKHMELLIADATAQLPRQDDDKMLATPSEQLSEMGQGRPGLPQELSGTELAHEMPGGERAVVYEMDGYGTVTR